MRTLACSLFTFFFLIGGTAWVRATTLQYTVKVEYQGQPAPDMMVAITITDGVAQTSYTRYAATNSSGTVSGTASFQCSETNQIVWGIGAVMVKSTGAIEGGGTVGGSGDLCDNPEQPPMLILAASDLAFYDRHNSGPGCPKVALITDDSHCRHWRAYSPLTRRVLSSSGSTFTIPLGRYRRSMSQRAREPSATTTSIV